MAYNCDDCNLDCAEIVKAPCRESFINEGAALQAEIKALQKRAESAESDWQIAEAKNKRLIENLHRCHATSVKYLSELAARRSQVKFLRKIWKSAKKVASCFPEKIPNGTDSVRFDIPGYIIDELRQNLKS